MSSGEVLFPSLEQVFQARLPCFRQAGKQNSLPLYLHRSYSQYISNHQQAFFVHIDAASQS